MTDRVQYLPGGLYSGKVTYNACFHNLAKGLQTHCLAPAGLDIKGKWSVGGSLPGEPREPVELGLNLPKSGLYLREDVDMKCNFMMLGFVKKTLQKSHLALVARLVQKAHIVEADMDNASLSQGHRASSTSYGTPSMGPSRESYSSASSFHGSYPSSQSPRMSQGGFTPLNSGSFHNIDPAYRDARDSYSAAPQIPPKIPPYPTEFPGGQAMLHSSYAAGKPYQQDTNPPAELPAAPSPQQHELPARYFDGY